MEKIINYKKHPINNNDYLFYCKKKLIDNSILQLDNFLVLNSLTKLQNEALLLQSKAFYCSQKHTVLLNKKSKEMSPTDPCNLEVTSNKGCVPHDLISNSSDINKLYNSKYFIQFLEFVLGAEKIYPYTDTLSSINYNYYEKGQQLGWHFDNASFAVTLMIQSSNTGGIFQYLNKGRDYDNNFIDKKIVDSVLKGNHPVNDLSARSGTLILFYGRNYLHRVTPVTSKKSRILATLNYNLEDNIQLSENARITFFGRLK